MAINRGDLREAVIRPVLYEHNLWSPAAEELLMLTAAQESKLGYNLTQMDGDLDLYNNAVSPWQLERNTYKWLAGRYPEHITFPYEQMVYDLRAAALCARLRYLVVPEPIPQRDPSQPFAAWIAQLARYYKQHYNTSLGKATVEDAAKNYFYYVVEGKQ